MRDKIIVAIGGGEISNNETIEIDKKIIALSSRVNPNVLFIPTASHDSPSYIECFRKTYEGLGANVNVLLLEQHVPNKLYLRNMILNSDIIYVGGGDTNYMIKKWINYNVDKYLKEAYSNGIIMSGLSAGASCWFDYCLSDSEQIYKDKLYKGFGKVKCLGFLNSYCTPHYNEENRNVFNLMIEKEKVRGFAIDNLCAVIFINNDCYSININGGKAYYLEYDSILGIIKKEI